MPFPDGDYSDFNFTVWLQEQDVVMEGDADDAYTFALPSNLPSFLGQIPWVTQQLPNIASCSNILGGGEPTVSWPVQLYHPEPQR